MTRGHGRLDPTAAVKDAGNRKLPALLMYGGLDSSRTNTFSMQKRFDEVKVPYTIYKCRGIFYGQHTTSFIFLFKKAYRILDDVLAWLDQTMCVVR